MPERPRHATGRQNYPLCLYGMAESESSSFERTGPGSVPKHQALFGFDFHRLSTLRPGTSATNVLGGEQLLAAEEVRAKSLDGSLSMFLSVLSLSSLLAAEVLALQLP